jgi:hypothetical protein
MLILTHFEAPWKTPFEKSLKQKDGFLTPVFGGRFIQKTFPKPFKKDRR